MVPSTADRDLLLGVLAVQGDFLSRDQVRAGLESWLHDRSKPLGQVLRDQGQLTPERRQELDALVERYLKPPAGAGDRDPAISTISEGPGSNEDPAATGPFLGNRAPAGEPVSGCGNLG